MARAIVILGLVAASVVADESRTIAKGDIGTRIVKWVREAESAGFSGTMLAARRGEVVAATGVGNAHGKVPNTPATLFEIASATKQFTAAAALRLVDLKKLDLDAPMANYLPGIPENCSAITVRHLLQHTSGIPGTNSQGGGTSLANVLPLFLKGGPRHRPGTHWEYWNQGYALASEVIARASGRPYTEYCRKALFRPAKMRSTFFTGDRAPRPAVVAIGLSTRGPARSALDHPYGDYGLQYRGMGGVVTTVWDLWRWHRALQGRLLSEKAKRIHLKPGLGDYSLGWFVRSRDGRLVQSHGGSVRGFVCDVRRYPDDDACVFVLCNRDDAPAGLVADGVEQILFGRPLTVRFPRGLDAALVAQLTGRFVDAGGNRLDIKLTNGELRASVTWRQGKVSRMTIGRNDRGKLAVFQGGRAMAFALGPVEDGKVGFLWILGTRYERRK